MAIVALVAALDRATIDDSALQRAFAVLAPRAAHGRKRTAGAAWGAQLGLSNARERGTEGLIAADGACTVLFDGRLDNAVELRQRYALPADVGAARIALSALLKHGRAALAQLHGPWSLVLIDDTRRSVTLARDASGQRPLYFRLHAQQLIAASEELAVLAAAQLKPQPATDAVAAHFALQPPAAGRCFLQDVREVPPGCAIVCDARGELQETWAPALSSMGLQGANDSELAQMWHEILRGAIRDSVRDAGTVGLSLSGGLDSGALAGLLGELREEVVATAYSWRLPGHAADESTCIEASANAAHLSLQAFDGSELLPLTPAAEPSGQPNQPGANAFRALKATQYAMARTQGCDVLLSGNYGDHVYPDSSQWLAATLRTRRWATLGAELAWRWRHHGALALWRDSGWRAPIKRAFGLRRERPPAWLTPAARAQVGPPPVWPPWHSGSDNPALCRQIYGLAAAQDAVGDTWFADRAGLEVAHPYRHHQVLAFALAIPADAMLRHDQRKTLTRQMLSGLIPDAVRTRPKSGSLLPLFRSGVRGRHREIAQRLLLDPQARWPEFVERQALLSAWDTTSPREEDDVLVWQCISFEQWWRKLDGPWPMGSSVESIDPNL